MHYIISNCIGKYLSLNSQTVKYLSLNPRLNKLSPVLQRHLYWYGWHNYHLVIEILY